jgi:hypothetical protein
MPTKHQQPVMPDKLERWPIERLVPYEKNARTHSAEQVAQIAASIQEFGFTNPILVASNDGILAGHGRLAAAKDLGLKEVPVVVLDHLTPTQRRAYVLADNKLALNAGWDEDLLQQEIAALSLVEFDLGLLGWSNEELAGLLDPEGIDEQGDGNSTYERKVEVPVYEPVGDVPPPIDSLLDRSKADELAKEINKAVLPDDVRDFLLDAAERHVQFNFQRVADFYAHAGPDVQELMENSALVVVDLNKAIEHGFAQLSEDVEAAFRGDYPDA